MGGRGYDFVFLPKSLKKFVTLKESCPYIRRPEYPILDPLLLTTKKTLLSTMLEMFYSLVPWIQCELSLFAERSTMQMRQKLTRIGQDCCVR